MNRILCTSKNNLLIFYVQNCIKIPAKLPCLEEIAAKKSIPDFVILKLSKSKNPKSKSSVSNKEGQELT